MHAPESPGFPNRGAPLHSCVVCGVLACEQTAYTGNNITRESMYAALNGDVPRNVTAFKASKAFSAAVNAFLGEAMCLSARARCRLQLADIAASGVPSLDDLVALRKKGAHLKEPSTPYVVVLPPRCYKRKVASVLT